jgi:hypothetical protein
MSLCL